jgi:hypothetical protein
MRKETVTRDEWWADLSPPKVIWARLRTFDDGKCEVLDIDGKTHSLSSYSEAQSWLLEDEYERVSDLIAKRELPQNLSIPAASAERELLREMRAQPPELQTFFDRKFFESLGGERVSVGCGRPGCPNGAIELSTLCKRHHFENVIGRPYAGPSDA